MPRACETYTHWVWRGISLQRSRQVWCSRVIRFLAWFAVWLAQLLSRWVKSRLQGYYDWTVLPTDLIDAPRSYAIRGVTKDDNVAVVTSVGVGYLAGRRMCYSTMENHGKQPKIRTVMVHHLLFCNELLSSRPDILFFLLNSQWKGLFDCYPIFTLQSSWSVLSQNSDFWNRQPSLGEISARGVGQRRDHCMI